MVVQQSIVSKIQLTRVTTTTTQQQRRTGINTEVVAQIDMKVTR